MEWGYASMSKYYKQLEMLYKRGMITKEGLKDAVADGKITAEEYQQITGEEYNG